MTLTPDTLLQAKQLVWQSLQQWPGPQAAQSLRAHFHPDAQWHVSHPVNQQTGAEAIEAALLSPLRHAFPDIERRADIFMGGWWDGRIDGGQGVWISSTGHYLGTFRHDWLGIAATGEPAFLRYGEFYRVVDGRIAEVRMLLDVVDLARQAGVRLLPPSSGFEGSVPGPRGHHGLVLGLSPEDQTQRSMQQVLAMFGGLHAFNQSDLRSMGMEAYWHPDMMWYGPCGIGSSRGVSGFQKHHQAPFLHAFPDRKGGHHRSRFADGPFVCSTGWPSVRATHRGAYLGTPATDRPISMRVMDWWCSDGTTLTENWVFIDLPHLFLQFGVDLLAPLGEARV